MNLDSLRHRLKSLIATHGSQRKAAEALGLSQSHFHDLMRGKRNPGPKTLKALGLVENVTYTPKPAS